LLNASKNYDELQGSFNINPKNAAPVVAGTPALSTKNQTKVAKPKP
jgi:hypothetical protein